MSHRYVFKCIALAVLPASSLLADFSYEQTSKITGGALAGAMKFAGMFSKAAREPMRSTIAVRGDRMVTLSGDTASVIDLAKETMTEINFKKKEYSVMTFAELAQMMEELSRKMKSKDAPDAKFTVSVTETGQTRQINGMNTRQMIVKMIMEAKDAESGKTGGMVVTADTWVAPKVAGYEEITAFYTRMSQKMSWMPGGGGMTAMAGPEASKALGELYKEGSKLNGIPVLQNISMGAAGQDGTAPPAGGQAQQAPPPQRQEQAEKPSAGGALGSALGGRLGGFGRLGRRKQEQPPPEQAPQQTQQAQGQAPAGAPGSLLEMTTELTSFSSAPVDASKFEVPAGFKQVKPEKRMR